jgi:AraC family transcriptional regulator
VLNRIVHTCGKDAAGWELQSRFQIRNPQIEHLAWTLKAEFEQGCPNGRIFVESLATALGMEIVRDRGLKMESRGAMRNDVSSRRLKQVLAYIDDHLAEDLSLQAIAGEMAVSVSWLKQHFRKSLGVPLHHYIMRQRVERAADLLTYRKSPIREVALETGFSHQSHLAKFMRRILGVSPNELRK